MKTGKAEYFFVHFLLMLVIFIFMIFLLFKISFVHEVEIIKEKHTIIDNTQAWITFYQPTKNQCGNDKNITYSGEIGAIGSCAVSQPILDIYCNIYDTIEVLDGIFKGKYIVWDKSPSATFHIDIWKPLGYDGEKGAYYSKFKIYR